MDVSTTHIRWTRVLLCGLLAGLISNLSGISLAHFVLGKEYIAAFQAKFPPSSTAVMAVEHLALRFWFGILLIFLYAAMRPRFGAGPRTALIAATTLFCSVGLMMLLNLHNLGLLFGWKLAVSAGWTFLEFSAAALAGAWLYREQTT